MKSLKFVCRGVVNPTNGSLELGVASYASVSNLTYHKEQYKVKEQTLANAELLALFFALRIVEESGDTKSVIYHGSHLFKNGSVKIRASKHPQVQAVFNRLDRLRKKGYSINIYFLEGKKLKKVRKNVYHFIHNKNNQVTPVKLPEKRIVDVPSVHYFAINENEKPKYVLTSIQNQVIDFPSEKIIERLLYKKVIRKKNEFNYESAIHNYSSHGELKWINMKQLQVHPFVLKMDSLLPERFRKYSFLYVKDGSLKFIVSRNVAKQLVKEKMAEVCENNNEIRLLYTKSSFHSYIYKRDKNICQYCKIEKGDTLEHIHPQSKGGLTTPINCIAACTKCNTLKNNLTIKEFYDMFTKEKLKNIK